MKDLAFSIEGTQITLPAQIDGIQSQAGNFGSHIIGVIIYLLMTLAAILSLFYLVQGGIRWITSGGDAKQVEGARNSILYALIGLAVTFLSFSIINVLALFLKVPLLGK